MLLEGMYFGGARHPFDMYFGGATHVLWWRSSLFMCYFML